MTFQTWAYLNKRPDESREEARERYAELYGSEDDAATKQDFVEGFGALPESPYGYDPSVLEYTSPYTPTPTPDPDYVDDPDWWDQLVAGGDEATASGASALAGPVSGFLSDYVSEDLGEGLKGWAEDWRDINLEEAAQVKRPETREEILKRDPDSWYQYTPEFFPTGHEIIRSTPTSLAAAGIALPAAVIAGKAAGVVGLAALGKAAVGAVTGMAAGNVASSLQVAGESYERAKNDPVVREELGVDPDKDFKDLSPEDQQKVDRFSTDLSQSAFGHRLYTSGLVEMASFIPYGPLLARWGAEVGLGTYSELWDRELYAEDAAEELVEYGMPREKVAELQQKMLDLGPSEKETFIKALVQEGIMGGGFSAFESISGVSDPRINIPATASDAQRKLIEEQQKGMAKTLKEDAKLDAHAQSLGFKSADHKEQVKQEAEEQQRVEEVRLKDEALRQKEEEQARKDDYNFWENEYNVGEQERKLEEQREKLRQRKIDARAEEIVVEEDIYSAPQITAMNRAVRPILEKLGAERTAEEKVEVDAYKKIYGVTDEKKLLKIKGKKIVTQEKSQKRTKKERKAAQEKAEDESKRGMFKLFARNPLPDGTGTPGLWNKFKQVFGIAPAKDKGIFKLKKRQLASMFRGIEKKFKKFKGKFVVVDQGDLDMVFEELKGRQVPNENKEGEMRFAKDEENLIFARKALGLEGKDDLAGAWTLGDKIFINADAITGKDADEVVEQAIQLGMFHEPIAHIGLKESLKKKFGNKEGQKKFDELMDDFYRSNEKDINRWVTKYAEGYLDGQEINNLSTAKKRELAEEYLANVFVEFGVRDPNIIASIVDSMKRGGHDALFGTRKVTTVQMREMLADIQREYIGGERNIITGDFFDRSHWLKPAKRAGSKEQEEPQWVPPKIVATDLETRAPIPQKTLPEKTEGPLTPTVAETEDKRRAEATLLGKFKEKIKSKKKKTEEEPAVEATGEARFAKRVSTPEKRTLWQKTHKPNPVQEIKRRDQELKELAKGLEKGEVTFEDYRNQYEKVFPIQTFNTVPKLSSRTEIAGAINEGQYNKGKLIGEDSNLKAGMRTLVRFDVDSMNKFNVGVVTAVSSEAKGSHYGRAAHLVPLKDGTPVKMVTNQKKDVLGIATGEGKFPMAFLKGAWKGTSASQIRVQAQKALKDPNWIQVGMNPTRQTSFYARETKVINGKKIEAGTPLGTAEEVLQVGMFVIAKNPTTKAVPTFTSMEGAEVRFSKKFRKQKAPKHKTKKMYGARSKKYEMESGVSVSPFDYLDKKKMGDPLALNQKIKDASVDPMSGVVRFSKKPQKYGAKDGDASWITWADEGNWIDFGRLKDLEAVKKAAEQDYLEFHFFTTIDPVERKNSDGPPKGVKELTSVDAYVEKYLTPELINQNQDLKNLYRQYGGDKEKIKKDFIEAITEKHVSDFKYNWEYLQQGYLNEPFFMSAIMRAMNYAQDGTNIGGPTRVDGAALAEVYEEFSDGKYTGLKRMYKDYKARAEQIEETRADKDKSTFVTTSGGKWMKLPKIDTANKYGEETDQKDIEKRDFIINRWHSLSRDNWCTTKGRERVYPYQGPMYVFRKNGESLIAIRFVGEQIAEIQSQKNNGTIPGEYLEDVKEFVENPNVTLSSNAKKTIDKARIDARKLAVIEEKKEEGAEWEEALDTRNTQTGEVIELKDATVAWRGTEQERFEYFKGQEMLIDLVKNNPVSVIHGEVSVSGIPTMEETLEQAARPEYDKYGNIIDVGEYYWVKDITDILDNTNIKNMEFTELKNIYGKLEIGVPDRFDSGFSGTPYIHEHMISSAPKLISVNGQLTIGLNAHLPLLENVGGDVLLSGIDWYDTKVGLKSIGGDLDVRAIGSLPDLQTISGSLFERIAVYPQDHEILANKYNLDALREKSDEHTFKPSKSNFDHERDWEEKTNNAFVDLRNLESVGSSVQLGMDNDESDTKHGHKIRFDSLHEIGRDLVTGSGIYHRANPVFPQLYSVGMNVGTSADQRNNDYDNGQRILEGKIENKEPDLEGAYLYGMLKPIRESDRDSIYEYGNYINPDLWVKPKDAEKNLAKQSNSYLWETIGHRTKNWQGDIIHEHGVIKWRDGYGNSELDNIYTQKEIDVFRESSFLQEIEKTIESTKIQPFLDKFHDDPYQISEKDIKTEIDDGGSIISTDGLKTLVAIEKQARDGREEKLYRKNLEAAQDHLGLPWTTSLFPEEIKARKDKIVEVQRRLGIKAPNLTVVGRDVSVYTSSYMPNLKRVGGDINIYLDNESQFNKEFLSKLLPNIEKVGGRINFYINSEKITLRFRSDQPVYEPEPSEHKKFDYHSRQHLDQRYSRGEFSNEARQENRKRELKADEMGNPFPKLNFMGEDHHQYDPAIQKEWKNKLLEVAKTLPDDTMGKDWILDSKDKKHTFKESIEYHSKKGDIFSVRFTWVEEIKKDKALAKQLEKGRNLLKAKARREQKALQGTVLDPRTQETTRFAKLIRQPAPKAKKIVRVAPDTKEPTKGEARFAKKVDQPTAAELEAEFLKKGGKVKPDTEEPTVGININDSKQNFTEQILSGRKTMETRDTNSLKSFIGKTVGIIRTGKGKAEVVGYATIGEPVVYNNRAEFKKDQSKHLIKTGSDYDIRTGKTKYGYPLTNVTKISPFPVTSKGIVSRKIDTTKKKADQPSDKVSLGNEKFASGIYTRESISPKQFVNPKGEVRTSKILMRSAAAHAMGTSTWNPFTRWTERTQPLADKLLKHIVAQGTLPDRLKYHALRRRIKGIIKNAEDAGKELYDVLKNTKQADVIFNYFTTKGANPRLITDRTERAAAIAAKEKIDSIGRKLVDKKLMREKTRQEHEGAYLPQVYLKYLLGQDNFRRAVTRGGVAIDMKYLIARKDIPEGVKKLIYGEIKDPAYLASKATSVPVKDMAILDWLGHIAANPNWVVPKSMVSFDALGTMKGIIKDHKLSKELLDTLDIKDTKAVKVSSYWLENESARINDMKEDMELTAEEMEIVVGLTKAMKKAAKEITGLNFNTKEYRTVPESPKYGMLAGIAVRKEIYDDIFGGMSLTTGDISTAEAILGNGSLVGDYNRLWKWAKVPANPPSWVRNFGSNLILMNLGGVSVGSMPGLMISSLADMRKAGKHKGKLHQLAKDLGLTAGTFSNVEIGRIEREFKHLEAKLKGQKSTPWAAFGAMKGAFAKFRDATTDFYGGIDSLGKMMMLKHQLDKQGIEVKDLAKYGDPGSAERLALDDIAANAEKWLFDYSNVLPSVRFLRQAPFGAPFISFTSFVGPLMLETAITKPWKFAPYYALGWAMKEWFKNNYELDDEDLEGLKVGLSEYLREKATESFFPTGVIPLPWLDENKRVQFLDVSYIYPWGMFSEIAGELSEGSIGSALKTVGLMGSPLFNIASAVSTGIDPFSRREIIDPNGTPTEQAMDIWWYAFNLSMPPMLHGAGPGNEGFGALTRLHEAWTGELTKEGEARFTMGQAFGRMAGFNITPLAVPEGRIKHLRWDYSQLQKLLRQAKRDIRNMFIMQKPKSEIEEAKKEYLAKIRERLEKFKDKVRMSQPPESLIKERRSFQRQKEKEALRYAQRIAVA